jgi:hypothetical protein
VTERDGTVYPARSLSDGTLRFLALTVIDMDPAASGVICLEEPENGLHPDRIPAMLRLLRDIACDPVSPAGPDNTLRQVIVNTHSPAVVSQVPDDSLLSAELKEVIIEGTRFKTAHFSWLADTWRSAVEPDVSTVARGRLLPYLNPISASDSFYGYPVGAGGHKRPRRVADRPDMQGVLSFVRDEE